MTFPVIFHIFGIPVPAHEVCELSGYVVGVQTYVLLNRRRNAHSLHDDTPFWMIVWCAVGALIGSKILGWIEMSPDEFAKISDLGQLLGGKTIVGGLIGGWIAVEIAKKFLHITDRTGDV